MKIDPDTFTYIVSENKLPEASLLCMYDFSQSNYDSSARILSVDPAQSFTSGQIVGHPHLFTGTIGSGNFEDSYVEIKNASNFFNPPCSFVFSLDKNNNKPVSIFNNITTNGLTGSGYSFGINSSNNLWFKTLTDNEPTIVSSDLQAAKHNLWGVSISDVNVKLMVFDSNIADFQSQSFVVDSNFTKNLSNLDCTVGSGEYNSSYFLDYFLVVSGNIDQQNLTNLAKSSFQEYFYNSGVTGLISGQVTGFEKKVTPSGTGIFYQNILSGYVSQTKTFVTSSGVPLTGLVGPLNSGQTVIFETKGDSIEPFEDSLYVSDGLMSQPPHFFYTTFISDGTEAGPRITGFSGSGESINVDFSGAVYVTTGVTGLISSGISYSGITGSTGGYLFSGASSGVSGDFPDKYRFSDLTFLGTYGTGNDLGEYILLSKPTLFNKDLLTMNNEIPGGRSGSYSFNFPDGNGYTGSDQFSGVVQVNGATQYQGYPYRYLNNIRAEEIKITGGNYYITGVVVVSKQMIDFNSYSQYDSQNISNAAFELISSSGWSTSAQVSPDEAQVYINGQKCYSGIDYESVGGTFTTITSVPSTDLSGVTGLLFGYDKYQNSASHTGLELQSLYGEAYPRDGFIYYANGVRYTLSDCAQYSRLNSLLTGLEIYKNTNNILYSAQVL